ncbi:putative ciliary rootlet coiled-coil protein 2 [Poecilia reticulata]|uniref:putative ciliary rootlet coiled-coil protein 2 n=1 Tax=Poecilia reticulata TaxID=8081 RepID=UPI0007E93CE4|nr:PREDICTED: putative ciliary rootlet coiled-coil protein 2 [Poecilia reticulata]
MMSSRREQDGHSPRLEAVIQQLEKTLLQSDSSSGDRSLTLQGDVEESGATPIPIASHICQIIARNLAEQPAGESFEVSKLEESGALREHSSPGQMDDDQPLVKQTSLTERAYLYSAELQKRVEQDLNIVIQKQTALLQEERSRSASLSQVNSLLREQLDQVDIVNKGLMESLRKVREDAQRFHTRLRSEKEVGGGST